MAAKDRPPSFPFYPRDLLSSTAYNAMNLEQRGAYFSLFCHAWLQRRQGWLEDDDTILASLSGMGDRWPENRAAIARAFSLRPGWWVQLRLVKTRRDQRRFSREQKRKADAGWTKRRAAQQVSGTVPAMPGQCSASASASAFASKKESNPPTPLPPWLPLAAWGDFEAFRKAAGKGWTLKARELNLRTLQRLRDQGHDPTAVLEQSIANGWKGLFEVRPKAKVAEPSTWPRPEDSPHYKALRKAETNGTH